MGQRFKSNRDKKCFSEQLQIAPEANEGLKKSQQRNRIHKEPEILELKEKLSGWAQLSSGIQRKESVNWMTE